MIDIISKDKLIHEINKYSATHFQNPQYIICNEKTCQLLCSRLNPMRTQHLATPDGCVVKIYGINVAICEALEFGEIDIK